MDEEHDIIKTDDLIKQTNHLKIDKLKVCRLGMIDPQTENLCKLFYFANSHEARKEPAKAVPGPSTSQAGDDGSWEQKLKKKNTTVR